MNVKLLKCNFLEFKKNSKMWYYRNFNNLEKSDYQIIGDKIVFLCVLRGKK